MIAFFLAGDHSWGGFIHTFMACREQCLLGHLGRGRFVVGGASLAGALSIPLVSLLMVLLYPLAKPIALILGRGPPGGLLGDFAYFFRTPKG